MHWQSLAPVASGDTISLNHVKSRSAKRISAALPPWNRKLAQTRPAAWKCHQLRPSPHGYAAEQRDELAVLALAGRDRGLAD
jgi:hypothetical protein